MTRILVVDDDLDTLTLVGLILEQHGFEALKALDGPEALSLLTHDVPDLMLLDLMMPKMDGNEVCQQVKADPRTAHLPVVILTAKAQAASQAEAFRAGADDYITKPVHPEELIRRIQAVLERSAATQKKPGARVISVLGVRGGVGATTLAVNLALVLASQARTILVDLDAGGTTPLHLGLNPASGLGNLLMRPADEISSASVEAALTPHPSGLRLLAAADALADPAHAGAILNHLLSLCEVCVFDLGAGLNPVVSAIAPRSNGIVLALDSDRVTLAQASRVVGGLNEARWPQTALQLVWVNRLGTPDDTGQAAIRAALGRDPAAVIGPAPEALYQALERGQPLVAGQPDHPVVAQVRALAALV